MSTGASGRRVTNSPSPTPTGRRMSLTEITTKGNNLPNRWILHAPPGWGKTSFGAHFPSPVFLQSNGETGLETLIDAGRLPEIPHFPACVNWAEANAAVDSLIQEKHNFRTVVFDCINGFEKLCHEEVCRRDYGNDWSEKGFEGYQRGAETALGDWKQFLCKLNRLREQRMTVVCLCHTGMKPVRSNKGDYDHFVGDMHKYTWGITHPWADNVLYGTFEVFIDTKDVHKKGKATGGQTRILYTEFSADFDAKNRIGLPTEIVLPNDPDEAWKTFCDVRTRAIAESKAKMSAKSNGNGTPPVAAPVAPVEVPAAPEPVTT